MVSPPPPHSYPSPTQAQISDGTHPFYAPQQQQHAPQAVMDPQQQRPREHSMPSNQGAEDYAPRPVAVHPQPYNNNLGNPEYPMQQMQQQVIQQSPHVDISGTPLAKRPKTSRACDQCRNKKTRCDEVPGTEGSQCVSCRRNNQMCEFSREPQKRGPSKGYIKELAERVDLLEKTRIHNKQFVQSPSVQLPATSPASQVYGTAVGYPETPLRFGSSKRTHSVSEDLQNSPALQAQLQASADLPPTPGTSSFGHIDTLKADKEFEMSLDLYYSRIHDFLPFLPHNKEVILATIEQASLPVKEAFLGALHVYSHPGVYSTTPLRISEVVFYPKARYARMVSELQHDSMSTQTPVDKLVVLQTILLMIFAAEFNSPATTGNRGWYIQALGASTFLYNDLRAVRKRGVALGNDHDQYHLLARRAFLTLVIMERWNAAGISAQTIISEDLTKLVAADKVLLGTFGYNALRASFVLGHIVDTVLGHPQASVDSPWTGFSAEMERVREDLEETNAMAILPKFLDLYFYQQAPLDFSDDASPKRIMEKAYEILALLPNGDMVFPFTHHVVAMAVMIIDEAIRKHEVGDEARQYLRLVRDLAGENAIFIDGTMWAGVIKKFAEESLSRLSEGDTTNRAGLQHLADAAVGETEAGNSGSGQEASKDPILAPVGYLTYVVDATAEKPAEK